MEPEPPTPPIVHQREERFHGFWPLLVMGTSLLLVLSWEILVGVQTRQNVQQTQEQQLRLVDQAKQVEVGLEKLVRGLVDLSKTDDDAKRLVTKFGIKINEPAAPSATPR
jgi:type II secretory pathway component PulJ